MAGRTGTGSTKAATGRATWRCTASPSSACDTTNPPETTPPGRPARARTSSRSSAASNGSSPARRTGRSSPYATTESGVGCRPNVAPDFANRAWATASPNGRSARRYACRPAASAKSNETNETCPNSSNGPSNGSPPSPTQNNTPKHLTMYRSIVEQTFEYVLHKAFSVVLFLGRKTNLQETPLMPWNSTAQRRTTTHENNTRAIFKLRHALYCRIMCSRVVGGKDRFNRNMQSLFSEKSYSKRNLLAIICLCCAFLLETFVFNLPFWQTLNAQETIYSINQTTSPLSLGAGLSKQGNNLIISNTDKAYIDIHQLRKIKYLQLQSYRYANSNNIAYTVSVQFNAGEQWHEGTSRTFSPAIKRSQYVNIGGTASSIRLRFTAAKGSAIPITGIIVNPRISFHLSLIRLLIELFLILFIVFLGPKSPLYHKHLSSISQHQQKIIFGCITIIFLIIWTGVCWLSGSVKYWTGSHPGFGGHIASFDQYDDLAKALLHGHLSLDLPVDQQLKAMPNPYDYTARSRIAENGATIYFDYAFYNGKYYSYFGVVPALLFFVPFRLLTGLALPTTCAVLFCCLVATIFATILTIELSKHYGNNPSIGCVLFAIIIFNLGSGIAYQTFTPSFYCVPQAASYMFTVAGLSFWLLSKSNKSVISSLYAFLGTFSIALNLGCRPQFILSMLLAVPIFWDSVFRHRTLFSRKGLASTVAICSPIFLIFIPLFLYNYFRFGNILNFGSNYNLTGFDMTNSNQPILSLLPLAFYYLFQPGSIIGHFPFVSLTNIPVLTWFPMEPSIGGIFMIAPFLLLIIFMHWIRKRDIPLRQNTAIKTNNSILFTLQNINTTKLLIYILLIIGAFILVADAKIAGYAWRYDTDFCWAFCIVTMLVLFQSEAMTQASVQKQPSLLQVLLIASAAFSFLYQFFSLFTINRYGSLIDISPSHYYAIANWFLFLL